jgi:hypothetical protein
LKEKFAIFGGYKDEINVITFIWMLWASFYVFSGSLNPLKKLGRTQKSLMSRNLI